MDAWWLLVPAAYLVGMLPTAEIVGGWVGHDPTAEGSGNPGASNVYRVAGRRAGVTVLAIDLLKGALPALVGLVVGGRALGLACGVAAMLGHIFPITRGFHGGKGVATFSGASIVLYPVLSVILLGVWLVTMKVFFRASLGSLVLAVALPLGVALRGRPWWEVVVVAAVSALVIGRHHSNIARLLRHDENSVA